jgi:DNA-binding transcriptional ArsR family regulator
MTVLTMSAAEITRFDTLMRLDRGEIRIADAMELLGLERRQVYRLLDRLRQEGAACLVSRKRGRPSNRRYSYAFRAEVVALGRENYAASDRPSRASTLPSAMASACRARRYGRS